MKTKKVLSKRLISFLISAVLAALCTFQIWLLFNKTLVALAIAAVCLFFAFCEIKRAPVEPEAH